VLYATFNSSISCVVRQVPPQRLNQSACRNCDRFARRICLQPPVLIDHRRRDRSFYWFLWVRCPACRTIQAIELRLLDRHPDAAVSLIPALSCRSCRPNAPFAELPIKNEHRGLNAGGESLSRPESGQTLPEVALGRRLGDPLWDTSGDDPTERSDEYQTFDALTG